MIPKSDNLVYYHGLIYFEWNKPGVDAVNVMIVLCLELLTDSDNGLYSLLISQDVCLYRFVLLGSRFHSSQVNSKVVLRPNTSETMKKLP